MCICFCFFFFFKWVKPQLSNSMNKTLEMRDCELPTYLGSNQCSASVTDTSHSPSKGTKKTRSQRPEFTACGSTKPVLTPANSDDCKMNISEDNSLSLTETNKMNVKINSLVSKSPKQFSCLKSTEKRGHSPMQSGYRPYVNRRGYGFNLVVTP